MILNGYSTFIGKNFAVKDSVISNLKMLVTTGRLEKMNNGKVDNVYFISNETGDGIPQIIYPISLKDNLGKYVTVFDKRHYMNSKGNITNPTELEVIEVASTLQQMAANGNIFTLQSSRKYTVKAFSRSISNILARESNLDIEQKIRLEIILGFYHSCLLVNQNDDYKFVATNILTQGLGYNSQLILEVIEDIGFIASAKDLIDVLNKDPVMLSLNKLDVGAFFSIVNRTWFVSSGFKMLIGASIEMPHLYTAICYASATNRLYQNTGIGKVLDVRENKKVDDFIKLINSAV